jgi:hypothetical protein
LTEKPTVFMVQNNEHAQAVLDILKVKYPQGRQNQSRSPDFSDRILFYSFEVNR